MRNLLVPVNSDGRMWPVLETARLVADIFGSYIEGIAQRPELPEVVSAEFIVAAPTLDLDSQQKLMDQAHRAFDEFMNQAGVPPYSDGSNAPSFGWAGRHLATDLHIGSYGRLFDLIVLGRPNVAGEPTRIATVEAALFESGRPLLLVPPSGATTIGKTVVIAWNGSTETARTVALAMPFLQKAQRVIVLSVDGWEVDGPSGESLARNLLRAGIAAEATTRDSESSPGQAVLKHVQALGGDLLIKGAYTQSRLRQMIFGGATRHIMSKATVPVLIAH
ncbi:universal stress protein [Aurantimonas sp. C2-6-R+9]|uniref:universal stress protein n=1 Tax=unclassified Aurantimonas TaxID=2638230 RepID=UPI002E1904C8|nr:MULTISPECIES: universal stress protein [unclassified Aurantimonas]MEC5290128.1 universal stress protein [Aurantimonas sp. C2-3-R2]MEC5380241.1 universal stress protein [Aurantimonas sp. C2-6-R+9]MEC5411192.1 universal stress protein [Aurantimonas sp. C2-4-R8]